MNNPNDFSADERRLRAALTAAADEATTSPDALARIRRRTARSPLWRRPAVLAVGGLVAASAVGVALILVPTGGDDVTVMPADSPSTTPTESSSPTTTPEPTAPPGETPTDGDTPPGNGTGTPPATDGPAQPFTVPVYYAAGTSDGDRLVREFHAVESTDPVLASLTDMFATAAVDPDYHSLWASAAVPEFAYGEGTVDVMFDSAPELAAGDVELAVQQLVYTITAAAASDDSIVGADPEIRILVGGEPVTELGGVALPDPLARDDQVAVRQLVQVNNPSEGATVTGTVTVDGEAAVFEATLLWEVRDDAGTVVDSGTATSEECCRFTPFSFEVDLPPGIYEIAVSETDPSGGEGRAPSVDTKRFTVSD